VPAQPVEDIVLRALDHMRLIAGTEGAARVHEGSPDVMKHLRRIVRRVEIAANSITTRLNPEAVAEQIRAASDAFVNVSENDSDLLNLRLAPGQTLARDRDDLVLTIPIRA
jgi:hypothetical protein